MSDKNALIQPDRGQKAVSIHLVDKDGLEKFLKSLSVPQRAAIAANRFAGAANDLAIIPDGDGDSDVWAVVAGVADTAALTTWCMARLAEKLPAGTYRRVGGEPGAAMLGWIAGQYSFERYLSEPGDEGPRVLLTGEPKAIDAVTAEAEAVMLVRDLVNTPAEDMGPAQLETEAENLHKSYRAEIRITRGDLLERDFPMVHAVGRAASRSHAPRMIELEWGDPAHPRVAIVGKGVCFDSGGLDIKPGAGMLLMKKDMGGAAHALALARLIMGANLPVRLHLLVPAVENAIAGNAFRPGDVLKSRAGISVEIGNTDAEGRLILGDALTRAGEGKPDLIIDFATLTGAARVAVGPDLPALFTRLDATADALLAAGKAQDDPCWRLPLHEGYREYLKSDIADINNAGSSGFAGASTAALFLDRFVPKGIDWAHFDTFAWRPAAKPGRPKGGDALGLRAAWHMLRARYA
ncbi:M17 family metallopeptidase [Novosphingobium sp. P6W]|uniref:leucyl aminopeptidase family protein n=1 Tax=Novosphingobium sp. P6W TaxID=1609758 RepID=UPI0005C322A0|nr:leucyl aminopeptidase family protein [Novosphingobium sp. P6W]AXB77732.1 leucyl aminopeptidase family protein [Novosphingobium sp. P6W]KIS30332.1 cytosol aminopeptidase [Novosphingobium sp. P6W]